jgi:hypothetical protein
VEIGSAGTNTRPAPSQAGRVLPPTTQSAGACAASVIGALRSGWSKQANVRCASSRKLCW